MCTSNRVNACLEVPLLLLLLVVLLLLLQTYAAARQWLQIVQQMFQETGLPLVALMANKADTTDLQAQAAQLPAPTSDLLTFSRCAATWTRPTTSTLEMC